MDETCPHQTSVDQICARLKIHLGALTGRENIDGVQVASLLRLIANQYEIHNMYRIGDHDLSGPRLGVLLRLMWQQHSGEEDGLTPTELSQDQRVSRNTVSSLLRGLENQGLIKRRLDPTDRRAFRIVITDLGRGLVKQTAPQIVDHLNELVAEFPPAERSLLLELLGKLYQSLLSRKPAKTGQPEVSSH